ncbi:hypothetical protein MRX96_056896 [Rhipicephalus microplus]
MNTCYSPNMFIHVLKGEKPGLVCSVGNYTDTSLSLTCSAVILDDTSSSRRLCVEVFDTGRGNRLSAASGPMIRTRHLSLDFALPPTTWSQCERLRRQHSAHMFARSVLPRRLWVKEEAMASTTQRGASRDDYDIVDFELRKIKERKKYYATAEIC